MDKTDSKGTGGAENAEKVSQMPRIMLHNAPRIKVALLTLVRSAAQGADQLDAT